MEHYVTHSITNWNKLLFFYEKKFAKQNPILFNLEVPVKVYNNLIMFNFDYKFKTVLSGTFSLMEHCVTKSIFYWLELLV